MHHFICVQIRLSILFTVLALPLQAEVLHAGKERSYAQSAGSLYAKRHAAGEGAADRAAFRGEGTLEAACEKGEAMAKLFATQARTASITNQADAVAQHRRETEQRLKSHAEAIQPLSLLLERLSPYPVETLLAVPASLGAYRHGMSVLRAFAWPMKAKANASQGDQADFNAGLAAGETAQKRAVDVLDRDITGAIAACAKAEAEVDATASYTASTTTLHTNLRIALAAQGVEQRAEGEPRWELKGATKRKPVEPAEAAAGRKAARSIGLCAITTKGVPRTPLRPPVRGFIVKGWGEATDAGPATGVSYQALPGARVIAPCGGRVVFANSFRSYGQLLIVDYGDGYHMVFSGLEKLDVQSGQMIGAGHAVGIMPLSEPRSRTRRQVLYIELRHNGHPVNPMPWLRNKS